MPASCILHPRCINNINKSGTCQVWSSHLNVLHAREGKKRRWRWTTLRANTISHFRGKNHTWPLPPGKRRIFIPRGRDRISANDTSPPLQQNIYSEGSHTRPTFDQAQRRTGRTLAFSGRVEMKKAGKKGRWCVLLKYWASILLQWSIRINIRSCYCAQIQTRQGSNTFSFNKYFTRYPGTW